MITVGAVDPVGSADPLDDSVARWSGYGLSLDGFSKPDVAAPGRYTVMPVPGGATIPRAFPGGSSTGATCGCRARRSPRPSSPGRRPSFSRATRIGAPTRSRAPLMLTANYLEAGANWEAGVGDIDAAYAASLDFVPPNPDEGFIPFVERDSGKRPAGLQRGGVVAPCRGGRPVLKVRYAWFIQSFNTAIRRST